MATLKKYNKDLKRDDVVKTNDPAEINELVWGHGFEVVKPKATQQQQSDASNSKSKK